MSTRTVILAWTTCTATFRGKVLLDRSSTFRIAAVLGIQGCLQRLRRFLAYYWQPLMSGILLLSAPAFHMRIKSGRGCDKHENWQGVADIRNCSRHLIPVGFDHLVSLQSPLQEGGGYLVVLGHVAFLSLVEYCVRHVSDVVKMYSGQLMAHAADRKLSSTSHLRSDAFIQRCVLLPWQLELLVAE